uniref:Nitroreductase domain-containing protein n=1 Tax=Ananas comosus var. bracteatus TaxID=296719 RepID=A0A6V7QV52_ANACO
MISLSSVFWREAWKYGERALRYCNHDAGHALAAVAVAAAALGWDARLLDGLSHADLEALIGVPQTYPPPPVQLPDGPVRGKLPWIEAQHPDCALLIFPAGTNPAVDYCALRSVLASKFSSLRWLGKPNSLSREHVCWNVIYETAEAIKKPPTGERFSINPFRRSALISQNLYKDFTVREVVRKRRSAVDMDRVHVMERNTFYQILLHCLPSGELGHREEGEEIKKQGKQCALPFRVLTWDAECAMRPEFEWERPDGCPDGLPLYRLARGDCQELAKQLSCHQDIASDGCFSLGMVARFEPVLREKGAWMYPRLFWETGVLGQVLYLEAHAVGISATGIGCYFDDAGPRHKRYGVSESLPFHGGRPMVDKRIMSLPAYPGPGIDA